MGTVTDLEIVKKGSHSATYENGVVDGRSARSEGSALTLYLQVGIDDYAKGFRAGFFGQLASRRV